VAIDFALNYVFHIFNVTLPTVSGEKQLTEPSNWILFLTSPATGINSVISLAQQSL
jgi:hypothetical protein